MTAKREKRIKTPWRGPAAGRVNTLQARPRDVHVPLELCKHLLVREWRLAALTRHKLRIHMKSLALYQTAAETIECYHLAHASLFQVNPFARCPSRTLAAHEKSNWMQDPSCLCRAGPVADRVNYSPTLRLLALHAQLSFLREN